MTCHLEAIPVMTCPFGAIPIMMTLNLGILTTTLDSINFTVKF